ncbi:MAG: nitroreductase family protein [Paenibacillus macerans]|uniref:Nitroreductase n=1 Tax=Paenibacillus macerans TaxID=44252 RepID=A0A090XFL1_PAEMA|nr:nitroreductase family protein [Paenibacillus macerans]KFM83679.1 nitroreductase [Paenibacillus macerans]MCY7559631.1 nitroreductase family protein [Paenibacillus macerans]MDU7471916.1 nitroreductase family protein [Paenibacillus macerans]MEC0135665.1 nitroreductase family protein [Paenibacillus macerans]MEC0149932.1 nitroreductase family protein [Paenibacillus macerans]
MSVSQSSQTVEQQQFFNVIQDRRSVRSYDPEVKIPREEMNEILQQATLAPSGANLQPWRFLVIDSQELKQKLLPIAFNQQQVIEASAVIAVLGDLECYKLAEKIYGMAVDAGYMPAETAKSFVERYQGMFASMPKETIRRSVSIDGGLVSMQLMLVARAKGYDTVPMGGYDQAKFVEAFDIPERYAPVMLIAIGKAAKPGHPTVRLPIQDVAFFNEMPKA